MITPDEMKIVADIGGEIALPFRTRSRTAAELTRRARWHVAAGAVVYVLILAIFSTPLRQVSSPWEHPYLIEEFGTLAIMLGALLVFGGWWWVRRFASYRDPELAIEVRDADIAISGRTGVAVQPYAELVPELVWMHSRARGTYFAGIRFGSPVGRIELVEPYWDEAPVAAAAITCAHDKWRVLRRTG